MRTCPIIHIIQSYASAKSPPIFEHAGSCHMLLPSPSLQILVILSYHQNIMYVLGFLICVRCILFQ